MIMALGSNYRKRERSVSGKFVRNTGWLIFDKVFHMSLSLLVTGTVSRYLGVEGYGILNYGLAFLEVFTVIAKLGIDGILVNEIIKQREGAARGENDRTEELLGTAILLRFISGFLSIIIIYIFVIVLNPGKVTVLVVTMIQSAALFFTAFDTIDYYYQSKLESRKPVLARSISYPCVCVFRIILVLMKADVSLFGLASVMDALLLAVILMHFYKIQDGLSFRVSLDAAGYLLRHSIHFIAASFLVIIYTQMDRIMVQNMSSEYELGIYSAAMLITNLWIFIPNAILESGRPIAMERKRKGDEAGYERRMSQICGIIQWVSIAAGIGISAFGWLAIRIIYGVQFSVANRVLLVLIWSKLFSQMGAVRSVWMLCEGIEKYIKYFVGLGALINLFLNTLLIPEYGAVGAAIATLVTEVVSSFVATMMWLPTRKFGVIWVKSLNLKRALDI